MIKVMSVMISFFLSLPGFGQNWQEWTQQKKTQIKYLEQQIAALQVYIGYIEKGYAIAQKGLTTISDIKNGDFHLHLDYISSLEHVNPRIKNYVSMAEIAALQVEIIKTYQQGYRQIRQSGQFTAQETTYIYKVYTRLLDHTADNFDALLLVISDSDYTMKDDERLKRIDQLFSDTQDTYRLVKQFSSQNWMMAAQRTKDQTDVDVLRKLNDLQNP